LRSISTLRSFRVTGTDPAPLTVELKLDDDDDDDDTIAKDASTDESVFLEKTLLIAASRRSGFNRSGNLDKTIHSPLSAIAPTSPSPHISATTRRRVDNNCYNELWERDLSTELQHQTETIDTIGAVIAVRLIATERATHVFPSGNCNWMVAIMFGLVRAHLALSIFDRGAGTRADLRGHRGGRHDGRRRDSRRL